MRISGPFWGLEADAERWYRIRLDAGMPIIEWSPYDTNPGEWTSACGALIYCYDPVRAQALCLRVINGEIFKIYRQESSTRPPFISHVEKLRIMNGEMVGFFSGIPAAATQYFRS